jgi:hypothetical protein
VPLVARTVEHEGWAAVELVHAGVRLVVVTGTGPRVAWLSPVGGDNVLFWDDAGALGRGAWRIRGGHRLWLTRPGADESEECYAVDDAPCRVRALAGGVAVSAPADAQRLEKSLVVRALPGGGFRVEHRVKNLGDMLWAGGAWGLTCVRPARGVTLHVPLGSAAADDGWDVFGVVVPRRWGGGHTSKVADPQLRWGEDELVVRPAGTECKRMLQAPQGIIELRDARRGLRFAKHAAYEADATYPLGTNLAFYVAPGNVMAELETMGPQRTLRPGQTLVHVERWTLTREGQGRR